MECFRRVFQVCGLLYVYKVSFSLKNGSYPLGLFGVARGMIDVLS
jgi:hypothetical protein